MLAQIDGATITQPAGVPKSRHIRLLLRIVALAITVGMVVVLVQAIRRDGPAALDAWRAARVECAWVALAIVSALAGHAAYVFGWRRLLSDIGYRANFWPLARIFLVSNIGRYLPGGKAWQMAIVAMMASEHGLPPATLAASSLFQGVIGVGVGSIVLVVTAGRLLSISSWWLVPLAIGVVGLLGLPYFVRSLPGVRSLLNRFVPDIDAITVATMWALFWTAALNWVLWGVALYALGAALLPTPGAGVAEYVAAWSASFLAGLIAIVSPAGLGAREGVMQGLLSKSGMMSADALVVVVVARIGVTLLDVAPALALLAWRRRRSTR